MPLPLRKERTVAGYGGTAGYGSMDDVRTVCQLNGPHHHRGKRKEDSQSITHHHCYHYQTTTMGLSD